jgi:Tfp pilus assembly protein PilO
MRKFFLALIAVLFIKIYFVPLLFGVIPELQQTIYLCSLPNKLQAVQEENSRIMSRLKINERDVPPAPLQAVIRSLLNRNNCLLLSERTVQPPDQKKPAPELVLEYRFAGLYPNVAKTVIGLTALKYPLRLETVQLTPDSAGNKIETQCRIITFMARDNVI